MGNKKKMNIGVLALCLVPNLANADTLFTCKSCYNKPANSYYISSGTNTSDCAWACFSGYVKKGNNCCVEKPANATYTDSAQCNWSCNSNYTKVGNLCCSNSILPSNAHFSGSSSCNNWACDSGYKNVGGKCLSCNTNCAAEIIDVMAVSNGGYTSSRGAVKCGISFFPRSVYGGSVKVNGKVIGRFYGCKSGKDGRSCASSSAYYICKDKLIEM